MEKYTSLPECLPYHPLSELKGKPGCYPNISPEQLAAANSLHFMLQADNIEINTDDENEFLKILRFLRARKFNVNAAFDMLKADVEWRKLENRLTLRFETAEEVLGCDVSKIYTFFPTWVQGFDKQSRPVSYRQFGKFEIWNVLKITSLEKLIRFHAWETEMSLRMMYKQSKDSGYNIETFVLVIDAAGWNMSLATSDAFAFIKGMASTDSDHYPERLGTMILINAPSMLSFAWRIIQGFLDPVTKEKINIFGHKQETWKPVLLKYIDEDQIPRQYGGTAPDPTPEDAIQNMNPPVDVDGKEKELFLLQLQNNKSGGSIGTSSSSSSNTNIEVKQVNAKQGGIVTAQTTTVETTVETDILVTSMSTLTFQTNKITNHSCFTVDKGCQTDECVEEFVLMDVHKEKNSAHNKYWTSLYHKLVLKN